MEAKLPARVQAFLSRHITSVEQLEILLLLAGTPGRSWTPVEQARHLRSHPDSAAQRVAQLAEDELVTGEDGAYRYGPGNGTVIGDVEEVADTYARRRHAVILAIYSDRRDRDRRPTRSDGEGVDGGP